MLTPYKSMKTLLTLIFAATAAVQLAAAAPETSYSTLEEKATRFYNQEDWSSASAMFDLMLARQPHRTATYSKAITAAGMRENRGEEMRLLGNALSARIPIDSLFNGVRAESFGLGHTDLYEQFLLEARADKPWLARSIDSYLLDYYTYRRNGSKMTEYAKIMLAGDPDNTAFTYQMAQGLLIDDRTEEAMSVYESIVERDPKAFDALVYLANHAASQGNTSRALELFRQAYAAKATPQVAAEIKKLTDRPKL